MLLTATGNNGKSAAFAPTYPLTTTTPPRLRHSSIHLPTLKHTPMTYSSSDRNVQQRQKHRQYHSSISDDDQEFETVQYIRPYLKQLFLLCRPLNFPIVALFHMLGVYQAIQLWQSSSANILSEPATSLLLPLLKNPSMLMVLLALLLVTSTSMITNDYYDARDGVDTPNNDEKENGTENEHYHPLANGEVPFTVTKTFDSYLYAILLLSSAFVPGIIPRLLVLSGSITTYLYTVHLKPRTWIKNISCASLVAMSPVTSGLAAWQILCDGTFLKSQGATIFGTVPSFYLIFKSPLSFLVVSLFCGIFSREVLMDITDYDGDKRAGIETVPVKYGKKMGATVALGCSVLCALSSCAAALIPLVFGEAGQSLLPLSLSTTVSLWTNHGTRKLLLAMAGNLMFLQRTFRVWKTQGEDSNLAERAVRDSMIGVVLVLASFV